MEPHANGTAWLSHSGWFNHSFPRAGIDSRPVRAVCSSSPRLNEIAVCQILPVARQRAEGQGTDAHRTTDE